MSRDIAELLIEFTGIRGPLPDRVMGFLALQDSQFRFDQIGPKFLRDGRMRFERVSLNPRHASISLFYPQSIPLEDLPLALVQNEELDLSKMQAGDQHEVELAVTMGGRIELHLVGRDPNHPPDFELQREGGKSFRPTYLVLDERGHDQARSLTTDGPIFLKSALEPGSYLLRQTNPAYAAGERELTVEAGRSHQVSFQLEPKN